MKTLRSLPLITAASLLLGCALHAQAKAAPEAGSVIKRPGQPDCLHVTDDHKEMAAAVQKARKTMDKLIAAVRSPKSNQSRFAVKKPFIEGSKVEHLWVKQLSFDGKVFRGRIDNTPVGLKRVRLGDKVAVAPEEISDWMFVQDDRLVGGYTIQAMCSHLSTAEKKQFEQNAHCRMN